MKRSLAVFTLFCLVAQITEAQLWKRKRYEVYLGTGPSMFFGDVGGFSRKENILGLRDISFMQTRFNANLGLKYKITEDVSVRLSLAYGMLHASDDRGSNKARGFEARTSIFEPALLGEYYFIKNKLENSYLFSKGNNISFMVFISALDIYAFTGIGGLNYKIKANDKLLAKGVDDNGFTAIIPVGIGANLFFTPDFNLGIDFGGRYTFSDNLDGYTSQYSGSNDVYYFFNFTFTYKILTAENGLPAFLSKRR